MELKDICFVVLLFVVLAVSAAVMAFSITRLVQKKKLNKEMQLAAVIAAAVAVYMARTGSSLLEIRDYIDKHYYPLDFTLDSIRADYSFDVSCQGSVPQAIEAFAESVSFEDAVRNAISIGGDSDTIAAITGGIAEAYYGTPDKLRRYALTFLDEKLLKTLNDFEAKYGIAVDKGFHGGRP